MSFERLPLTDFDADNNCGYDPSYILASTDKAILRQFKTTGRAVIWQRTFSPALDAAINYMCTTEADRLRGHNDERYKVSFQGDEVFLQKIYGKDNLLGRDSFKFDNLFFEDEALPLAHDLNDRANDARILLPNHDGLCVRLHTVTSPLSKPYHRDAGFDVLGVNYTDYGTETGPSDSFDLVPDYPGSSHGFYRCRDPQKIISVQAGSVSYIPTPHRAATTPQPTIRLWAGFYALK
jgi:hypothetical protein